MLQVPTELCLGGIVLYFTIKQMFFFFIIGEVYLIGFLRFKILCIWK